MHDLKTCFVLVVALAFIGFPRLRADVPSVSASGLTLEVTGFQWGGLAFAGGAVEALPSCEQYLVLNLRTLELHTLLRAIGDGDLVLATLTTDKTHVTRIHPCELELPKTRIPEFLGKREAGVPVSIACYGTSLTENGNAVDGWLRLLFDKPGDARRMNVHVDGYIAWENYAVGGTNARYAIALLGTAWHDGEVLDSPPLDCDLAIVGLLPNGGSDRLAVFEGVVRKLRDRGIEVLLVTDNPHASDGVRDGLWSDGIFVRELANHYDCALADTAAYMTEAALRGEDVYQDSIHQNARGHYQWARSVASVLAPEVTLDPSDGLIASEADTLQPQPLVPDLVEVDFTPVHQGGTEISEVPQNRLAVYHGLSDGLRIDINAGGSLEVYRAHMTAADLIFDASSSFRAELRRVGDDAIVKHMRYQAPQGNPVWAIRPQTRCVFAADESGIVRDQRYELVVTAGTLRLYGVSYYVKSP
jgi:hypothetical protein